MDQVLEEDQELNHHLIRRGINSRSIVAPIQEMLDLMVEENLIKIQGIVEILVEILVEMVIEVEGMIMIEEIMIDQETINHILQLLLLIELRRELNIDRLLILSPLLLLSLLIKLVQSHQLKDREGTTKSEVLLLIILEMIDPLVRVEEMRRLLLRVMREEVLEMEEMIEKRRRGMMEKVREGMIRGTIKEMINEMRERVIEEMNEEIVIKMRRKIEIVEERKRIDPVVRRMIEEERGMEIAEIIEVQDLRLDE